ncbi:rod shape-determining protein RodA [Flavobacteriales bacterium]|mgnify:FL=1|nr:rod shape-determining protein RodA [Flavobacteriales bacterium]
MRLKKQIFDHVDWWTISMYLILVLIGWLNIYAALYNENYGIFDFSQKYGRQLVWILIAFVIALFILFFNWKFFDGFAYIIYFISILSLIGVLLFGIEVNGAKSWLDIGFTRIQPSEFAKVASCMAVAKFLSTLNVSIAKFKNKILVALIILCPFFLIILQNDTGSALVYSAFILVLYRFGLPANFLIFAIVTAILFITSIIVPKVVLIVILSSLAIFFFIISSRKLRELVIIISLLASSIGFIYSVDYVFDNVLEPHHVSRIKILLGQESDPQGAGYNVNQSMIAIGSGGFAGKGFLNGTQTKFNFVPEQSTDFIFCTIGEEWGFIGSFLLLALYLAFLLRLIYLAERQRSIFSKVFGYGVVSILFFHIAINIAMTIGLAPVIGIPLPFLSYGGSSLWGFTILIFTFLNLDSYRLQVLR